MSQEDVTKQGLVLALDVQNSEKDFNIETFNATNVPGVDWMNMTFFNGKLYAMSAVYTSATVDKIGGWKTLLEKLIQKLGPPEESDSDIISSQNATWQFYDENRAFSLTKSGTSFFVTAVDKDAARQIHDLKKAKANVGF